MKDPKPQDILGCRLINLFNYHWHPIIAPNPDPGDTPIWRTETRFPIRPRVLWNSYQDAKTLVGVRFGGETTYALLDIDSKSDYMSLEAIDHIRAALETIGICRSIILRSSWSEGIHIYIPLPNKVRTFDLALALRHCLESQGFKVRAGHLEIFPNTKKFGAWWLNEFTDYNAHRLPLQPATGSCLLDASLQPKRGGDRLESLFEEWDLAVDGQDVRQLSMALKRSRERFKVEKHPLRNLSKLREWQADLEIEIRDGWTGPGQTNALLKTIACYGRVFGKLEGDGLREYVERIAITRPGYGEWCRHRHEIKRRCKVWAIAAESYYWPSGTKGVRVQPTPLRENENLARAKAAQSRILEGIEALADQVGLPEEITERAKAISHRARVSLKTLYRYLSLWHPDHWQIDQRCKIPCPERDSGNSDENLPPNPDPLKSSNSGKFYTLGGDMKGAVGLKVDRLSKNTYPDPGGARGGLSTGGDAHNE